MSNSPRRTTIRSMSPGRGNYSKSRDDFEEEISSSYKSQEELNITNKLNQLHLTTISIFSVNIKKQRTQEKYIVVRTPLGQKFVIRMTEENYFVSFDDRNNVYQYESYNGSFLPGDAGIQNLDRVLYTCGSDGLCIVDRNENGPYTLNFTSKNNITRETLMIEGGITPYPLINISELLSYNDTNIAALYSKINDQTCAIRKNFIETNLPGLIENKMKLHAINELFCNIKHCLQKIDNQIIAGCNKNKICCTRISNTKYERICEIVQQSHPDITEVMNINNKAEKFYSVVRNLVALQDDFSEIRDKLDHIYTSLQQLE